MRSPVVKTLKLTPGKTFIAMFDITFLGTPINLTDYTLTILFEESEDSDNFYSYTSNSGEITQDYSLRTKQIQVVLTATQTSTMATNPPKYWTLVLTGPQSYEQILGRGSVLPI